MLILNTADPVAFENACFQAWLNRIDARIDYDTRRALGSVEKWRKYFDEGMAEAEAVEAAQIVEAGQ